MASLDAPSLDYFFYVSGELCCVLSAGNIVLAANPLFSSLLGHTTTELLGSGFIDFVHEDDKQSTTQKLLETANTNQVKLENRLIAKDGTNIWVSWGVSKNTQNNDLYLVGLNVTDSRNLEAQLRAQNRNLAEAKARNEAILDSIGDGVVVVSDKGNVAYVNEQALSMLEMKEQEMVGNHLIKVMQARKSDGAPLPTESHPIHQALLRGKKVATSDIYFAKKSGGTVAVAVTASPVFLQGGLIGAVLVFRDITKEKDVDRMKTEFISLASHQLRTPLSATKWFSEMLLEGVAGKLTEKQAEMLGNIHISNERMIDLVNSLLNISRMESGRMMIDPKPTDLKKLIDEVMVDLTPKIKQKMHKVVVSVNSNLGLINVDPKLIRHVYLNFLTNAIKYTPENGEIHVIVSRKGEEIITQITDNGMGIPKKQQSRLFEKFFRADNVAREVIDGSGLGLYLVKEIIESSGGRIWFTSDEGKGTTFWFSLPVAGTSPRKGEVSIDS